MADATIDLLKTHFRQLRLPTMSREFEKLARDAAATNQNYFEFLLRLDRARAGDPRRQRDLRRRIKNAEVPGLEGLRHLRLQCPAAALQAEGPGAGALRMD